MISHRLTQTDADICSADFAEQKESSLREKRELRNDLFELAIDDFRLNLEKLRKLYPVKTICMHGSPLSKWDNRDLWEKYDYRDYGIIGEPYFDVDFNEVFYLTDTGRRWDGDSVSVRDKVNRQTTEDGRQQATQGYAVPGRSPQLNRTAVRQAHGLERSRKAETFNPDGIRNKNRSHWAGGVKRPGRERENKLAKLKFHSTWDIIEAVEKELLPDKIMLNTHPQRWTDDYVPWVSPSETLLRMMPLACFTG